MRVLQPLHSLTIWVGIAPYECSAVDSRQNEEARDAG